MLDRYPFFLFLIGFFVFGSCSEPGPDEMVQRRLDNYLIKDQELYKQISLNKGQLTLKSNEGKDIRFSLFDEGICDFALVSADSSKAFQMKKRKNSCHATLPAEISSLKVAIDPGHIASNMEQAKLESKYIDLSHKNREYRFFESKLNLAVARLMEDSLRKKGVDVMLTRDTSGVAAMGKSFDDWLEHDFFRHADSCLAVDMITPEEHTKLMKWHRSLNEVNRKRIFNTLFNQLDMYYRAMKINQFEPDITLMIHFNVDVQNLLWEKPSTKNYSMFFVPGAFMQNELDRPADQLNFLRLAFSDDILSSISLSTYLGDALHHTTGIPLAMPKDSINYLTNSCVYTGKKGVYCRNLAMTRIVKGILSYTEALYQDNVLELNHLSRAQYHDARKLSRIQQVATAYCEGLLNFYNENH